MDVTLVSNKFSDSNGSGIDRYSYDLYNNLVTKFNIKKIDLSELANYIKYPILSQLINKQIYFSTHINLIKNKNVHFLQPLLTTRYLHKISKKVVTFWDFYVFNKDYIKNIYPKESPLFKRLLVSKIRKLALFDILKASKCVNEYDYIFIANENFSKRLTNDFGIEPKKIGISYPIINTKFIPLKIKKKSKNDIIGYINSYPYNKIEKLRSFIEAFKKLENENFELHLYGKGFPFEDLIKDDGRIKYFGFLPEEKIVETYNSFDAYLSTSTFEGFSMPIIQAKACKIPILCYDGDLPNITKRNTLLWNDDNIAEILKSRGWEKVDVDKAYKDAEECRPNVVVPKIIKVYERIFG